MLDRESIIKVLSIYFPKAFAIDAAFLANPDATRIIDRLRTINETPLTFTHFNQLLHLVHEAGVTAGFFRYYFLEKPSDHCYPVRTVTASAPRLDPSGLASLRQLSWGLRRILIDALLFWGNFREAYGVLRQMTHPELTEFFTSRRIATKELQARSSTLPFARIPTDDRYLISQLACKAYSPPSEGQPLLIEDLLLTAYRDSGRSRITVRQLFDDTSKLATTNPKNQMMLAFAADEIADDTVASEADLRTKVQRIYARFEKAYAQALENTRLFLSVVNELDVYVATSMRTREDFRFMARDCSAIFSDTSLQQFNVRYFDPTISACASHEDKGLIECLMVKCCKILLYFAGTGDSFGKDAEVAMALSLGKPVLILCPDTDKGRERADFFRDVHPLSRLIDFETGVPCGAIVTQDLKQTVQLLERLLDNTMEYDLDHDESGYYRLRERLTQSVVRLQTSDNLIRESLWNYYHGVE